MSLLGAGVLAVAGLLWQWPAGGVTAGRSVAHGPMDADVPRTADPSPPVASTAPTALPSTAPPSAAPILRLPGRVPASGSGTFVYAGTKGEVLGRSGTLRRYRVAVEKGAGEDVEEFAALVDLALGDPRSWIGSGQLRLQRVPDHAGHDFTVYLATPQTALRMCAAGWVDIRVDGEPYTSCRAPGQAIINLARWRRSVDHFVTAEIPLATYRLYVVNHEVGHELGHRHERCPRKGRDAPVMMTQTLSLDGCIANPWPYLDGERYAGPPL